MGLKMVRKKPLKNDMTLVMTKAMPLDTSED